MQQSFAMVKLLSATFIFCAITIQAADEQKEPAKKAEPVSSFYQNWMKPEQLEQFDLPAQKQREFDRRRALVYGTDAVGEGMYDSCKEGKCGSMNTRAIEFVAGGAKDFKGTSGLKLHFHLPNVFLHTRMV